MAYEYPTNMGLLKTKYSLPGLNKHILPRDRLNDRLEESLSKKLTIITAPAGYGKTSAVRKWLEGVDLPSAWLSLDTSDNDPHIFWRYMCAALDSVIRGISQHTAYVFASPELCQAKVHQNIIIENIMRIHSDFLLVLDDFHLINSPVVISDLAYFIKYMPANLHIILTSRVRPALPLTRLGLKEDLIRIGAPELRFNTREISLYYNELGYSLGEEEIQRIESYTEGWAAALVAVSWAMKDAASSNIINGLTSSNRHIESYLAEDVYNTWTREQQNFMEEISILDRLCGPLCEAVTGYNGNRLLNELYEQNSFLVALDNEGIWFRYHHLFSDFLKKKLLNRDAAAMKNLHRRAAEWLQANNYYKEAIDHFLEGCLYDEAIPLIESYGTTLIRKREFANAIALLNNLPDGYVENNPRITFIKADCLAGTGNYKRAWECMQYLELVLQDQPALAEAIHAEYMMLQTDYYLYQGDFEKALPALIEAAASDRNNLVSTDYVDFNLFDISMYRSPYHVFIEMLCKNVSGFGLIVSNYRHLIGSHPDYASLIKGELYYEGGKLNEALPELIAAVNAATNVNCPGALVPAMVTLARIRRSQGDMAGAMEIIEECLKRVGKFQKPHWVYILKAFYVRLHIDMNDTETIANWVQESRLGMFQDISQAREYELMVLARVYIYQQRYDDAQILLYRLLEFAKCHKRAHSMVEIYNLLAINAVKNLDEESAEKHLEKALMIGMNEGYVRSFVDELAPMVSLLEIFIGKHKKGGRLTTYASKLLSQTKNSIILFPARSSMIKELLTSAEKGILQLILKAYSNQEIADELSISIRTVKAHSGNIYKKLGVKTRIQCIQKVKEKSI